MFVRIEFRIGRLSPLSHSQSLVRSEVTNIGFRWPTQGMGQPYYGCEIMQKIAKTFYLLATDTHNSEQLGNHHETFKYDAGAYLNPSLRMPTLEWIFIYLPEKSE